MNFDRICIFKTIAFVLGMVLLVSDFHLFFVENPAISVIKYEKQTNKNFPQILICGANSDSSIEGIQRAGFASFFNFLFGIIDCYVSCKINFGGKVKVDPRNFFEDSPEISELITHIFISFEEATTLEYVRGKKLQSILQVSLQGLCYSINLSKMSEKTINNIRIHLNNSFMADKGIPYVNVYLTPKNTNIKTFFTQPFTMSGDKLRDTGHNSITQYRVQVKY